jgi:hypothetical protein
MIHSLFPQKTPKLDQAAELLSVEERGLGFKPFIDLALSIGWLGGLGVEEEVALFWEKQSLGESLTKSPVSGCGTSFSVLDDVLYNTSRDSL